MKLGIRDAGLPSRGFDEPAMKRGWSRLSLCGIAGSAFPGDGLGRRWTARVNYGMSIVHLVALSEDNEES